MSATAILTRCKQLGVSLSVEGDMLAATPKSRLTKELRAAFRTHKPELMMILGGRAAAAHATRTLVLDFETHYSHDYSLKTLTTEAYVRDERFEALTLAVKGPDICKVFLGPDEIAAWIAAQDWSEITAVFHNAAFDAFILAHHYNAHPKHIRCTLAMSRGLHGHQRHSLDELAKRYGLPAKNVPYGAVKDKRWADLKEAPPSLLASLASGCLHDVELTDKLYEHFLPKFPTSELEIIDLTMRMTTQPRLVADPEKLRLLAHIEHARKAQKMSELGVTATQLQSKLRFAKLLEEAGEEVVMKKGKKGPTPAVARTDNYMQELAAERSDRVGDLARARLDVQSTIAETRAGRLASCAQRGALPVQLIYFGACTGRFSGAGSTNFQNIPRNGELRKEIRAPHGHKLVIADFSQIECRVLAGLSEETDDLTAFEQQRDLYLEFGSQLYGRSIANPSEERQLAKKAILGLGYGMGRDKFATTCKNEGLNVTRQLTDDAVTLYRRTHPNVKALWSRCDEALAFLADPQEKCTLMLGGDLKIAIQDGAVVLPNGMSCPFVLVRNEAGNTWMRTTREGCKQYWGGNLAQFITSALARIYLTDIMLKAWKELGIRPDLTIHDELVYCVPGVAGVAESHLDQLLAWMRHKPSWWANGPPMAAEGRVAECYGK